MSRVPAAGGDARAAASRPARAPRNGSPAPGGAARTTPSWTGLGRLARASARNRVPVLAVSALLMAILAAGIPRISFEDNPLDAMPRDHPNTLASHNLTGSFPGSAYASPVFVSTNPERWDALNAKLPNRVTGPLPAPAAGPVQGVLGNNSGLNDLLAAISQGQAPGLAAPFPGPDNITDEVYMRAMEELHQFLQREVEELQWGITLPSQVKLVNYTNTGVPGPGTGPTARPVQPPDPDAFSMPDTSPAGEMQYASAWSTYFVASPASVRSIVSADWTSTRLAFLFAPGDKGLVEVGDEMYRAVAAYKAELEECHTAGQDATNCDLEWPVFDPDDVIVDPRGAPAAASHLTRVTVQDLVRLTPFAVAFVGLMLFIAFRRVGTVLAMTLPLAVAGFGVLGVFGWAGIPIHSVSLLVFPVLIGTGIDFGIHMATSYHHARREGGTPQDAAFRAGQGAGIPLLVVTITTLVGMAFLLFGPNTLLQELGLAIVLGLTLLLLVSLTCLPAALSWTTTPPARPTFVDRFLHGNARFWGRRRVLGVAVVVVAMVGSLAAAGTGLGTLVVGTPAAYFPDDDPQRQDFEASNADYFANNQDLVSNAIVLEGPIATTQAMEFLAALEAKMKGLESVRADSAVSIHFALNAWIQVRQGTAGAPAVIAQESANPGSTFPATDADVKALMDEMFAGPLSTYATFFVRPDDYRIGIMLVELRQPDDFDGVKRLWDEVDQAIAEVQAEHPDSGLRAHLAGSTAVAYLFTAEELPYLQTAAWFGLLATAIQVAILRRSLRDAFVVSGVVVAAGLWWLGLLALLDIPLSIALVVPLVILEAIGSDYALHLRYAIAHEGPSAWGTVGRAVYWSALTDIGAFLVFAFVHYGILRDATIATVLVLVCALLATLVLVPSLARRREVPA